jgi:hypothetical protein
MNVLVILELGGYDGALVVLLSRCYVTTTTAHTSHHPNNHIKVRLINLVYKEPKKLKLYLIIF